MTTVTLDIAAGYREARLRIAALSRELTSAQLARPVPACPGWTVKDVVAHLGGAAADLASGNMANAPEPEWTAVHVKAGAGSSVDDLLDGWDQAAREVEPALSASPDRSTFFVADVLCHEIDILSVLGRQLPRFSEATRWMAGNFVRVMGRKVTAADLPALALFSGDGEWVAGEGAVGAQVEAPGAFELTRAMTGRRSREQIRAWQWTGDDADIYLPHLSVFEPRPDPLVEPPA